MATPLKALANLISSSVQTLESAYSKKGVAFPSLDDPFQPGSLNNEPDVETATNLIIAAAHQIIATVRQPVDTVYDYAPAMYMSAALGLAVDINVPDVLKDVGPQGLHVNEIGREVEIDGDMLARVLRYLATRHVFREVAPNVFANNRLSSILVKAHPFGQLKANQLTKYDGASTAAMVGHFTDDAFKSSVSLATYLRSPREDSETPLNLAWGTNASMWEWFQEGGNKWRGRRFFTAITGAFEHFPPALFTDGEWCRLSIYLPDGSVVVDVGGGVGPVTLLLAKAFPNLKFVVEDQEEVISTLRARKFWEDQAPNAIADGSVLLKVQNFFEPQTVKHAAVYFLRMIMHDWPDSACVVILKNLRAAASSSSKLVIFDAMMPYACADPSGPPSPYPLLGNLGLAVGGFVTMFDLQMLTLLNGKERTLSQFAQLGAASGWKFEGVRPGIFAAFEFSAA
ncbi:S-adenosyl-L-methionine-dependent methyltransferase [Artomyces pyxidatus]|uniref:S-adenosyl-L-methionine-dependent methyltransferase n=1 Tax=Artomyces pyxidatus TaxID=48021 RepID=A0ACB8T686_9AGAM|nr:S-adenosyl-L-methionine-dependent methyltransferase [Artomyces pyxidatus]